MAIVIRGKTPCQLCGGTIQDGQEIVMFPVFVSNALDPLVQFNDNAYHAECFHRHPLAEQALARRDRSIEQFRPGNRICGVCNCEINSPEEYFALGHLTDDEAHPLYKHNYTQYHRSHLPEWSDLPHLRQLLKELQRSGAWKGYALNWYLEVIEEALSAKPKKA